MGTMLLSIGVALFFSLVVFFLAEEKSLKNANFSDMKGLFTEELKLGDCLGEFNTIRYMLMYLIIMAVFDFIIANFVFVPNGFGSTEILEFVFVPAFIGAWIILLVKWTYQPVIKIISAFMFGIGYIVAAAFSFALTFMVLH